MDPYHAISALQEHTLPLTPLCVELVLLEVYHPQMRQVAWNALLVPMSLMINASHALLEQSHSSKEVQAALHAPLVPINKVINA
jgi:hypothetical protein